MLLGINHGWVSEIVEMRFLRWCFGFIILLSASSCAASVMMSSIMIRWLTSTLGEYNSLLSVSRDSNGDVTIKAISAFCLFSSADSSSPSIVESEQRICTRVWTRSPVTYLSSSGDARTSFSATSRALSTCPQQKEIQMIDHLEGIISNRKFK